MNRVLISSLTHQGGIYSQNGVLFSGVGFELDADKSVRGFNIENGEIRTRYTPLCVFEGEHYTEADLTGQLADYDLVVRDGNPYSGVGYEFVRGHCGREVFLEDGAPYRMVLWNGVSGKMEYFDVPNKKFGESYEWHNNGNLKIIRIQTNDQFFGSLCYDMNENLWRFSAQNGFLSNIDLIESNSKYFPRGGIRGIFDHRIAETLSLGGSDITDVVLDALSKSKNISNVKVLKIDTAKSNHIDLESSSLRTLKRSFPRMQVFLDGAEVVV